MIKHWKIHNLIRSDRYKETVYKDEKSMLTTKENNAYSLGIPDDNQMETQVRLGKDRLDKDSTVKDKKKQPAVAKTYFETDPELDQEFKYFLEMRKSIKATNSEHAIDLLIKKLETLSTDTSGFNRETALETIRQSTLNSWKGLFPLKEQKAEQKKGRLDWIDDL